MQRCGQFQGKVPGTVPRSEASTADRFAFPTPPLPSCNDAQLSDQGASSRRTTFASHEAAADITSFPIELLSELFSYLAWTRPLQADFVVATHVCRYWRIAALDNPLLWSHVSATSVSKARVFFERSKRVPLDVCISSPDDVEAMLNLLRSHSVRVRSLHVETSDLPTTAQYLVHLSQMQVPILASFHLEGPELSLSDSGTTRFLHALQSRCGQEHWTSPMPFLRHLHIHTLGIPWEASLYQNLSVLRPPHSGDAFTLHHSPSQHTMTVSRFGIIRSANVNVLRATCLSDKCGVDGLTPSRSHISLGRPSPWSDRRDPGAPHTSADDTLYVLHRQLPYFAFAILSPPG